MKTLPLPSTLNLPLPLSNPPPSSTSNMGDKGGGSTDMNIQGAGRSGAGLQRRQAAGMGKNSLASITDSDIAGDGRVLLLDTHQQFPNRNQREMGFCKTI